MGEGRLSRMEGKEERSRSQGRSWISGWRGSKETTLIWLHVDKYEVGRVVRVEVEGVEDGMAGFSTEKRLVSETGGITRNI